MKTIIVIEQNRVTLTVDSPEAVHVESGGVMLPKTTKLATYTFTDPWDCEACRKVGKLCELHAKMSRAGKKPSTFQIEGALPPRTVENTA